VGPQRWIGWTLVGVALAIIAIAVYEWFHDDPVEALAWALFGLVAGGRGVWTLRSGGPG